MGELQELEDSFTPVGDSRSALPLTRRNFIGAGMASPALPLLLGPTATSAALLSSRKCESTLRFEEDANALTITWYPELEIGEQPHELGNRACAQPPKPSQTISASPEKARSWRLIRKAFGPDAKFRLRLDKVDNKDPDVVYSLEVTSVRFGKLAGRTLLFKFTHRNSDPKKWSVELSTDMWGGGKASKLIAFSNLCDAADAIASSPARKVFEGEPDLPEGSALELEGVNAKTALQQVFGDDLQVKEPVRLQLATNGVWSILPAERNSQKPSPFRLADGALSLPKGLRMAWCDPDPASLEGDAASRPPSRDADEQKRDKAQQSAKPSPTGRPEKDPVFLAWGEVSQGKLLLGTTRLTPRAVLTAMPTKLKKIDRDKPANAQQKEGKKPAPATPPAGTASASEPARVPPARTWPDCVAPAPEVDWTAVAGDPADIDAFQPPQWRFLRRDWSLKPPVAAHPTGVSSVRASWTATVSTGAGEFGPIFITDGVLQRGITTKGANTPTLRFAGQLRTTDWEIDTRIGKLCVKGAHSDGSVIDPQTASARTHRPLMTLSSSGYTDALSAIDVPLLLLRSDLAPEGCEFSEFNFAPTGLRAVYDRDAAKARNDLLVSESYLWLGDSAALRELPLAHIDLTRARIDVARPESLARLGFMFASLHLDVADGKAWITDRRASCRVQQRIEPSGNGEPIVRDTRPVLVAEFPPQHVFEEAVFRPSEAPLPDVVVKRQPPTFAVSLKSGQGEFSIHMPKLLRQLEALELAEDHKVVRLEYARIKRDQDKAFGDFADEFKALCDTAIERGSLPPLPERGGAKGQTDSFSPAYNIYIGPDELPPALMATGREANHKIRHQLVEDLLNASLRKAERFIDLLNGKPPTTEEISSKFFDFVTTVLARINPFKAKPEWPISPRDHARMVEQATSGALQDYASFRDFYAGWILEQLGAKGLLPDDMEFFSPNNRAGLNFKSAPSIDDRVKDAKADYIALLQNMNAPKAVMRARLSGTSRLAFHVDCGSRPHMDVEDGDAHFLAQGNTPGTRLPFSFDALTDWAHYDLAVTPRAREAASFDEGGVLIRRELNDEGQSEDDSASADVAMLKSLGIRSGQEPKRPQRPGRPRDWGKKLRTLQERLTDVEASLSVIPDDLQTAIEIPARLILSPSQKGQWRTRRNNLQWALSSSDWPVPLWTANLDVDGGNPLVRAVASPDMRPEFLRAGLDRRLFSYQRSVPNTVALHTPAGAAPPRGPRAPWTLGFEESDPNTSKIEDLLKATRSVSDGENKSEENICAGSSTAIAASAGAAASVALAIASTASGASAPKSAASAAAEALPSLHPLVDYLCSRQIERTGYADHALFRSTLDAYDRHEIVLLSSAWGLPVRGRREKTGQLQALRFSSQVELPEEWHLLDAEAGTAIYRPRALKIQELALTALGGTLRHDSDFVPPAAARHIVHGPLFDSMSVERWQHWTVLGRDVFAEVVYKGYLFPIGHRASLVKQTERILMAPAKMGSKDPDPHAPLRCYLRQRMFIRVARPEKAFPAYGQPNGGRMFPADVARMLTRTTPDIVDPSEDNTLPQAASKGEMLVSPGGRLYANEAGLVFWPRTARIAGAEVVFDVQIQGAATKGKLIFVDNVAVNRPDLMDRLVQDYNALPSPDVTSNNQVDLQSPDLQKHLRTLNLHGQSLRYCDEIKPGSASHKTLSWTLKATGGVGVTNMPRPLDKDLVINKYEGPVHQFDDPLLEGADQPPFYPAIHTARIRIDQVERLTGGSPQAAVAQFEGWYVRNGFERDKRTQETDQLGIYMDIVNKVTMDMGNNGSRSGGVMRPAGEVIALSRERGPMTGTGRLDKAGAIDTVVDKESGFPLTPAPAPAPQRAFGSNSETPDGKNAKKAFDKFFSGNDALKTKILGLVSVSDLVEFLDVKNAAAELPLLREVVEYGMSGAEGAADSLRINVIAPLHELILELGRQWDEAGRSVNERSGGLFNGMGDVFPDVNSALQDLKNVLSATSAATDDSAVLAALSGIYECGRRLMDACGRVAANPLDQLQVAVKQKLEGFNKQIEGFNFRPDQLSPKTLMLAVYGYLPEFEKHLMEGAFARLQNLQARLNTLRDALEKLDKNATDVLARVEELQKVLKDAETGITAALKNTIDRAPGPGALKTPLLQAEDLLLSMVKEFDGAVNKVRPQLAAIKTEPGSAADKALKDFTTSLIAAQAHTAATLAEWSSPDLIARSEYRRAVANLATLLRLYTTVRTIDGNPESLLAQVSQVLLDYLTAQIGPRRPDFPQLEVEAGNLLAGVLEPIRGGAEKLLAGIVNTELVFPPAPLPDLNKKNALDKWPVSAGGKSVVEMLQAVARKAHDEILSSKLKDPQFKPVREQLAQLGTAALAAQVILHRAAIGVQLPTPQSEPFDKKNLQASMQRIDSALRDLERLGDSAVLALRKLQEDLIAISQKQARDALTEPVREAIGSIIQWFLDLNGTLQAKVSDAAKKVEPKSFLQPWLALLDEYGVRISSTRTLVANTTEWIDDPSKLLPALRDPMDAARQTGIQAVLMLQQALVDKAMDWAASFVVPVEAAADELKTVFSPLLELLKKSYAELEVQRKNVLEAAGTTAGQLLMGAMLVGVDKSVIFVTGKQPDDSQIDASVPDKDQLHWDTQSLEHLLKVKLSTLQHSEQLRAFNFMNYLVTGWRNGQATPLRIVEQLKRLSLEEIRARLVALINFGAIREEIEERIKLLIPSAVTMSYDFSTKMSDQAQAATAGVFCPKDGCALTVRTRARVDLLQANAPTFLSIGELGAFDIRLLGSFDAVTLHFKGVRFTSRGGSPECDLQYEGFTIGKQLEYLSQLTPFFGSKAGSGFYLQPLDSGIGVEAGYRLDLGAFTVGNLAVFNVSLNAAARLPFDNRGATFVASLSRRDSPFTIAIAPYGGSGFFALEADTKGIVGFEASFEYGGAGAFAYGPLSGQGRLMVGAYIRSRYDHTEIFATFYVGGSASIWIFNFGASLYVNAKQEGSQMKGTATYTFSFSMGIVDYDYKVAVNVALSLDGSSNDKAQKKQADRTVSGDASRWQDETRPLRLASLEDRWSPGDVVSDVAARPLAMMIAAGATAAVRKPASGGASMPPSTAKRRVATKCQTESWSTYSNYFDKDLAKKVQKLKAVY